MPILLAVLLHVSASSVQFFGDRFVLQADGNVRVSDGSVTMRGDAFSMDLKLNRFVLAGHVRVESRAGVQTGAAVARFFDFDRTYFVPLDGGPDRWTFAGSDFAHPLKGRDTPGDAFNFFESGPSRASLTGTAVTIGTRSFVRFTSPVPHVVSFASDPHLSSNSLAGASADGTWTFAGSSTALSALHARYDAVNHGYLAFEQHFSGERSYAVFSLNPLTRSSRAFTLIASQRPSDTFQMRAFVQLQGGARLGELQFTQAFPRSSVQLTQRTDGTGLQVRTFWARIGKLPVSESLVYGNRGSGFDLRLRPVSLGTFSLSASTLQRFFTPSSTSTLTLSRPLNRHLLSYAAYQAHAGWSTYGYTGRSVFHSGLLDLTYSNGGNLSAWVLLRRHWDAVHAPGALWTPLPANVTGQAIFDDYAGQAPIDVTANVRFRLNAVTTLDVQRTYYFNYGRRGWSPQFALQFAP